MSALTRTDASHPSLTRNASISQPSLNEQGVPVGGVGYGIFLAWHPFTFKQEYEKIKTMAERSKPSGSASSSDPYRL